MIVARMELDPTLSEVDRLGARKTALCARALQPVLRLVEADLAKPLAVADMARAVGLSQYHFSREFHRVTGVSPYAYIKRRRIARGSLLLAGSDMPIVAIARLVGFRTHAHFTNAFVRMVGMTPRIYRSRYGRSGRLSRLAHQTEGMDRLSPIEMQAALSQMVDLTRPRDVQYWCRALRCTEAALRCAVESAGPLGGDIARHLSAQRARSMQRRSEPPPISPVA
jgi:AraC-like DNA-binding protein